MCGSSVPPKGRTGPRSTYCSKICRTRAGHARAKVTGAYQRAQAKVRKPVAERRCIECGQAFGSKRDDALTCSSRCGNARRDRLGEIRCSEPDCLRGVRAKGLCSMHWKRAGRLAGTILSEPWNERRRANWHKRYALTRGAPDAEAFDCRDVYERDGWTCGICATPVDKSLVWPHPLSVSLDHVLPVSRGGAHAPENAQCAHLACNVRKGAAVA